MIKFYDREKEIAYLQSAEDKSKKTSSRMTVVMGRRRIGKTTLLARAYSEEAVYFFVSKKSEPLLCAEYLKELQIKLDIGFVGEVSRFEDIFIYVMQLAEKRKFTLIIDEFQEFFWVNPSIYSVMQRTWDLNKDKTKLNLVLCGSVYSLMYKIFQGYREPLFGRATGLLRIKPFSAEILKLIMADYRKSFTNHDLLAMYLITGGVAKYVDYFIEEKALTLDKMLDSIFSENTFILEEGKNMLVDEFGKDYGTYFSILTLIASSKTSRPDIESILETDIGGYLDRLENDFNLVEKIRPILAKPQTRAVKYRISDNFLCFWFRFIYNNRSKIEIGNFDFVKNIIKRDYDTFSGIILERYFREKLVAEENLSAIGSWWEKGNQNEIDIVGINEVDKRAIIVEVKRNPAKIKLDVLKKKATNLVQQLPGYSIEYRGLSIRDM
ncbi:MAG: ATP-binding protein [Spirochaetaceae bacterium]|jgi:AAA+ ATPase superfamily predicted ATPase|nr:ATP-binding protein [Spirochaetaceae bacterium]